LGKPKKEYFMRELNLVELSAVSGGDAPNGQFVANPGNPQPNNVVAIQSTTIIQNGQFVSQQAQAGTRSAGIQLDLGH
jgi:hypothetical protein